MNKTFYVNMIGKQKFNRAVTVCCGFEFQWRVQQKQYIREPSENIYVEKLNVLFYFLFLSNRRQKWERVFVSDVGTLKYIKILFLLRYL